MSRSALIPSTPAKGTCGRRSDPSQQLSGSTWGHGTVEAGAEGCPQRTPGRQLHKARSAQALADSACVNLSQRIGSGAKRQGPSYALSLSDDVRYWRPNHSRTPPPL
ncbi:hypothetical protein H920_18766 [Fukomys damarensis]|uniref:Uncharacterized protein n=1 Tax=Fukomys damarensis TaxID=885580 RepID=A0A091CM76_FUKDA|nr:hypothetical protein H920_18766 [Fukomys damarensis]